MGIGRKVWRKPVWLLYVSCQSPHYSLSQLQVTPAVKERGGSNKVVLLKAIPLLFLHVQIFLCSDCLRLLPLEQHMNIRRYFTCQGGDKSFNSSRGCLTNSLAIYSCYHNILGVGLNARLNIGVGSLIHVCLEIMELE